MALRDVGTASMAYFYFDFRDVNICSGSQALKPELCVKARFEHVTNANLLISTWRDTRAIKPTYQ
jgi:hypothetical protein